MNKKNETKKFEFILYINKNIICQRYFSIQGFNQESTKSLELKHLMDRLVGVNKPSGFGLIPNHLKLKSIDHLWKFYNQYAEPYAAQYKNNFEKEDTFDFEIRDEKGTIAQSTFSGNYFPMEIRYRVDIKELIPSIIGDIQETLSQKSYTTEYL